MEKCEVNANDIKKLDERVTRLERYRETDKDQIHTLDTSLQVFIKEMKHISDDLKTVVGNFKEAITRSTNAHEKEILDLKETYLGLERRIEILDTKLEQETVVADAEKWRNITKYIITTIIALILGFVAATLGFK